jgi:hypothetical protein
MAQLSMVNPGDPITSANWNALVAAVQALSGQAVTGGVTVPSLFSLTLGNAVSIITLPSTRLALGSVLDSLGNAIDPSLSDSKPLVILNQMPAPGANVFPGSPVNLVVSPKPGSAPPAPKVPSITAFKPTQINIGAQLEIDGLNFEPGKTTVALDGVLAAAPSFPPSTPSQLFVVVPSGIPGAPATTGQTKSSQVIVSTSNGPSQGSNVTLLPPLANPLPTIISFAPTAGKVGTGTNVLTITGTGFDPAQAGNTSVNFGGVSQQAQTVPSTTQLTVLIPLGIPGVTAAGAFISVTVKVGAQTSPAVNYFIVS